MYSCLGNCIDFPDNKCCAIHPLNQRCLILEAVLFIYFFANVNGEHVKFIKYSAFMKSDTEVSN